MASQMSPRLAKQAGNGSPMSRRKPDGDDSRRKKEFIFKQENGKAKPKACDACHTAHRACIGIPPQRCQNCEQTQKWCSYEALAPVEITTGNTDAGHPSHDTYDTAAGQADQSTSQQLPQGSTLPTSTSFQIPWPQQTYTNSHPAPIYGPSTFTGNPLPLNHLAEPDNHQVQGHIAYNLPNNASRPYRPTHYSNGHQGSVEYNPAAAEYPDNEDEQVDDNYWQEHQWNGQ